MRNAIPKDRNFINSLANGFTILEAFSPERPVLTLAEIAARVPLSKTSVFRIAHTLDELGYLKFDGESKKYSPGPKILGMGFATLMGMKIREIARPYMEELSKTAGENVNLGILDGHEVVYIEQVKSKRILDVKLYVGSRISVYNTSIGRAMLAYIPLSEMNPILDKIRPLPEARPFLGRQCQKILKTLAEVRRRGYALSDEEWELGVRAVGAPILNRQGGLEAGLNLSVLSAKVSRSDLEARYAPLLIETVKRISSSLIWPLNTK